MSRSVGPHHPRPSGTETRDVLRAVLEDQATRQQRREGDPRPPGNRRPIQIAVIVIGSLLTAWMLLSPPPFIRPAPFAPLSRVKLEAGLRMDMYVARMGIERYRARTGRLPTSLVEALDDSTDARDLTYRVLGRGTYRLTGERTGTTVVWESDQPVSDLLRNARRVVARGGP